ncbi:MAG TPA: retron St85 family RNA-directed DNA polymerase [Burkholderiaceae bacterium]|nr:retron St85 family RNA-directed DNA polymerase [Burkholderiaceae bacterium]HMY99497.1 retron St85 family RNA-directed DNA polymerase [Burkholderiaceae bacterium]HNC84926.1 retron St85 family RNA-directed DNA polymerase [Nitrospira sp.]HNG79995.1 retron St85 family RNA-directed DNA polymerase [Burkholderiaceae bacterium]HNI20604.1 retron St85 family RNA-directed DNA polymerase [Nitrospira sp.]
MHSDTDLIRQIARDMGMLPGHLASLIRTAPLRYKVFFIEKKSGGLREVAQPAREVKVVQRWLVRHLTPHLPVHEAATAYRVGASIRDNAARHASSRYMLKLDFTNFFPSIVRSDISAHLERHCGQLYDSSARLLIAHTCCWARKRTPPLRLCIGAPISPLMSNTIMFDFDKRLASFAEADGVTYSRYADDLTFSTDRPHVLDRYVSLVRELLDEISYPSLQLNDEKTVFASRSARRTVTGLVITPDGSVSVGRDRKRLIRSMYHRGTLGLLSPDETKELIGLIAFVDSIEPGFSQRLRASGST